MKAQDQQAELLSEMFRDRFAPDRLGPAGASRRLDYQRHVQLFDDYLGRTAVVNDLNEKTITAFGTWLAKVHRRKPGSINKALIIMHSLRRFEFETVRKPVPRKPRRKLSRNHVLGFVAHYAMEQGIAPTTVVQLEVAARAFLKFSGRSLTWSQVTEDMVNRWIAHEQQSGIKAVTVHSKRRGFLTLWAAAYRDSLTDEAPRKVRKVRVPETTPRAFTREQVCDMIDVSQHWRGNVRGTKIPQSVWWRSFLMTAWDTALRLGDLLSLERGWILDSGQIPVVQRKTGHRHVVQLNPETIEAIDECMSFAPIRLAIWPLWCQRNRWYGHFRALRVAAGIPDGTSKWIRRASASYAELERPGSATSHLGHRSPELAIRHYLDPTITQSSRPLPPRLTPLRKGGAA